MGVRKIMLIATVLTGLNLSPAWAAGEITFIQKAHDHLFTLNKAGHKETITRDVLRLFDFDIFFKRVVVDFGSQLTPAQYDELKKAFLEVFSKSIAGKQDRIARKKLSQTRYKVTKKTGAETVVELTSRLNSEKTVEMSFSLVPAGNGDFRIVDLAIFGASLSRNYRSQFHRIFYVEGYHGLLKRMKDKLSV